MKRTLTALLMALAAALGVTAPAQAIVGGIDAVENPGVVSLWTDVPNRNRCSGTLVDDGTPADGTKWVLTAAHCTFIFPNPPNGQVEARTGAVSNTSGYVSREVVAFYAHPLYDDAWWTYDAMLAELKTPILPSEQKAMKWSGLPSVAPHTVGTIQGYGWTCEEPGLQCSTWYVGNLKRMAARVLPDADCPVHMDFPQLKGCYEEANNQNVMACPGDSGSGFLTKAANGDFQVRIIIVGDADDRFGAECSTAPDGTNGLGMGTDVSVIQFWMTDVIAGNVPPDTLAASSPPVNMTGRFIN